MYRVAMDMIELVGYTPLVKINHINPNKKVKIYAKLERYNPAGSVKDRIAKYMIEYGEKEGLLTKEKIVIEPTSGNTGIALAMICSVKGYRLELVMPETMSMERRKILTAYGAKIVLSEGTRGMDGAIDLAKEMAKDPKYYMPYQFENKYNVLAHYETTGEEIWRATRGRVRMFVGGLGTTGTLMGVSKRLKEYDSEIKIVGVEPYPNSKIQGLKNLTHQYVPEIYDDSRLDEKINVTDEDAFEMARLLTIREGIFCGISSGAAMWGAFEKAKDLDHGVLVTLFPDGGEKYVSTPLYEPSKCFECLKKNQIPTCMTEEYVTALECLVKNGS
ncbi:MAG TPA: cysteine synthase family protein [Thermodesulfobacteriota bacterium]|nr:cysteine synthase family protein [Thermodesulfobacteriota bacterium]